MARKTISDEGHNLTDKQLAKLQKRIETEYRKASEDVARVASDYFDKFQKRDEKMLARVKAGEVTEQRYKEWRLAQIGRGERLEAMSAKAAQRMVDADQVAMQYVSDTLPSVYALNRNYAAYTIASSGQNIDYTLWNESTVRRLLVDQPDVMPYYPELKAISRGFDLKYGKEQITKSVTSGILRGQSIPQMTADLMGRVTTMSKTSAVRAARTAVTSAENAGRIDQYQDAVNQGIDMEQEWMCTLDGRTRDSHRTLDGEHVKVGKKFSNGCRYPGDPQGRAGEVYNCRCTLVAWFPELKESNDARVTYREWEKGKQAEIDQVGSENALDVNKIIENAKNGASSANTVQNAVQTQKDSEKYSNVFSTQHMVDTLGQEFVDVANEKLYNCGNENIQKLYQKYADELKICEKNKKKGAYFNSSSKGIFFNSKVTAQGDSCHAPYQTFFHELGHNIDWLSNGKNGLRYSSNMGSITEGLQKDRERLKALAKSSNGHASASGIVDYVKSLVDNTQSAKEQLYEWGDVSDILEGVTKIGYPLGCGHGVTYHKREGATEKEFFAECCDSIASYPKSWERMQEIFPNACKAFEDLIAEIVKE